MGAAREDISPRVPRSRNAGAPGVTITSPPSCASIRPRQRWKLAVLTDSRSQKADTVSPLPENRDSSARHCDSSRRIHLRPLCPAMAVTPALVDHGRDSGWWLHGEEGRRWVTGYASSATVDAGHRPPRPASPDARAGGSASRACSSATPRSPRARPAAAERSERRCAPSPRHNAAADRRACAGGPMGGSWNVTPTWRSETTLEIRPQRRRRLRAAWPLPLHDACPRTTHRIQPAPSAPGPAPAARTSLAAGRHPGRVRLRRTGVRGAFAGRLAKHPRAVQYVRQQPRSVRGF